MVGRALETFASYAPRQFLGLIRLDRLLGDNVPSEALLDFAASGFAHFARVLEIGEDVTDPPGYGIGIWVDREARAVVRDELARSADHRSNYWLVS
jgi:hypothetical protein